MIRRVWRDLETLLPPGSRASAALLTVESLIAGLLEAVLLVLVVSTTLAVADGRSAVALKLPIVGSIEIHAGPSLLAAGISGVVLLLIHVHTAWLTACLSAGTLRAARDRAIRAFAGASWSRQSNDREGALQETVSTLATQSAFLVVQFSSLAAMSTGLFALLLAALLVDPVVTIVVLVFGGLLFLLLRPVAGITQGRSRSFVRENSQFTEQVTQWVSMAMDLRVFGVESVEAERLSARNEQASRALARSRFVGFAGGGLYRDLAILFLVGAIAVLYLVGNLDLTAVGAVVLLVVRSLSYAQNTSTSIQGISEQSPNLEALLDRLTSLEAAMEPAGRARLDAITHIELREVAYDYEPGRHGISGVTLSIGRGEVVGVVGPSGGGKSTLVQVLLRLRPPTSGSIDVSGVPYLDIAPDDWHRLVSLVPQEPRLFQGTVAENISFLRVGITAKEVEAAARAAHVLVDIEALPNGFDTELGPRGAGLSGGQKQRIAIARALVGRPELLVLDEPTSALDVGSEQLLQRTIEDLKGSVTLVIVAHRLTTLACCDRVIAMEGGRVKRVGTLSEALAEVSLDLGVEPTGS